MTTENPKKPFDLHSLGDLGVSIRHLVSDSRQVKPGDTFLAYTGKRFDARKFIPQAIAAGANAVLWERRNFTWNPAWQLPNLPVVDLRDKAGIIASHVYGYPSQKLWLVGITGTNGKTSCSHWFAQAMAALYKKTAVIGTLGDGFLDSLAPIEHTTPDATLLQYELAEFLQQGAKSVAMEVSSHGLAQARLNGATVSVAVLTNLSRDHLDYHGSMDEYAAAKAKLFFWPGLKNAVLNLDDVLGVELSRQLANKGTQIIGYGFRQPEMPCQYPDNLRILHGFNLCADTRGLMFDVEFEKDRARINVDLLGRFNASNLLAVLAALLASGFRFSDAVWALQQVKPIPGRMEKLDGGDRSIVILDYAHTPDALEKVLVTLREILLENARLICVFGCGGERDRGKRGLLGEVAARLADEVIVTSDNPRCEDPRAIIDDIVAGAKTTVNIEEDRVSAIYQAIYSARKGDIVLIAGKGHEDYQEIYGQKIPFSDGKVVQQVLQELSVKVAISG
jgi:UDP-N-acetylmuramoyl-L-alanyl-D-glutamate--2,6-diaminopimelate ligase